MYRLAYYKNSINSMPVNYFISFSEFFFSNKDKSKEKKMIICSQIFFGILETSNI